MAFIINSTATKYEGTKPPTSKPNAISQRDRPIKMKHCAYGHSVATLLNPRAVTTVSHKNSLTVARHATVAVAVPSTVHYPDNYKIKIYCLR
jgi:hypothetical protein